MTAKQVFYALIAALAVTIISLFAATSALTSLMNAKAAQLSTSKAQLEQLNGAQNGIGRSKRDVATYSQLAAVTKNIVPQDKDQAATVREITNIASANGVTLTSITFPSSSLGTTAARAPGATGSAPVAAVTKPNLSQLTPVANIPGVYSLQIIIGNNPNNPVTYARLSAFLRGLENNRRTATVSSISIQPQNSNPNDLVFTLTINTYIKP